MLDYLFNGGFIKTYDSFKEEAPDVVCNDQAIPFPPSTDHATARPISSQMLPHLRVVCWQRNGRVL